MIDYRRAPVNPQNGDVRAVHGAAHVEAARQRNPELPGDFHAREVLVEVVHDGLHYAGGVGCGSVAVYPSLSVHYACYRFSRATDWQPARVTIAFHPVPYQRRKRSRDRRAVLREMADRSGDFNTGGVTRRKIATAYRENAIHIACRLERFGPMRPRDLRAMGTGPKTLSILSSNFYDWFTRVARGVYDITAQGRSGIDEFPDIAALFRKKVAEDSTES